MDANQIVQIQQNTSIFQLFLLEYFELSFNIRDIQTLEKKT